MGYYLGLSYGIYVLAPHMAKVSEYNLRRPADNSPARGT
jgi:hypothetical protein